MTRRTLLSNKKALLVHHGQNGVIVKRGLLLVSGLGQLHLQFKFCRRELTIFVNSLFLKQTFYHIFSDRRHVILNQLKKSNWFRFSKHLMFEVITIRTQTRTGWQTPLSIPPAEITILTSKRNPLSVSHIDMWFNNPRHYFSKWHCF